MFSTEPVKMKLGGSMTFEFASLPTPMIVAEDFVYIPGSETYVAVGKMKGAKGNIITGLSSYEWFLLAQELGLHIPSAAEWGRAREYFEKNPDRPFNGITGQEIELNFISGYVEQTGSVLAFKENGQYAADVHDLLKAEGFDGEVALIDRPGVEKNDERVFTKRKDGMTTITDVTEMGGKSFPRRGGFVHGYDPVTGLITEVGVTSNLDFYYGYFSVEPKGTRAVIRTHPIMVPRVLRRFDIDASLGVSRSPSSVAARLSSRGDPREVLKDRTG
jgi:hypothetical protein